MDLHLINLETGVFIETLFYAEHFSVCQMDSILAELENMSPTNRLWVVGAPINLN